MKKYNDRGFFIARAGFAARAKEKAESWRREGLDIQLLSAKDILAGRFREQPLASR